MFRSLKRVERFGTLILLGALLYGLAGTTRAQMGAPTLDNWFYYQDNYGNSARWQYQPRLLVPFALGDGWAFTQRVDVPFYYTNATGPKNPSGAWSFGISDMFIEEIFDTPETGKDFRFSTSLRLVFPTGGQAPFGADQWQVAPGVGFNWRLPDVWRSVTIAPYARYFFGFDPQSSGVTTVRTFNLFPTVIFGLAENWTVSLYPEHAIQYNDRTGKWFVPIEAMLTRRQSRAFEFAFGGAYAVVDDDPSYRWLAQVRLTLHF
jgi:hypothetical protein